MIKNIVNFLFETINTLIEKLIFFDLLFFTDKMRLPFVLALLCFCAVYFTFKMGFVNIRFFKHAIDLVLGKYDASEKSGEISHFKALTTALSATVGLGNIAGVAVAISVGGPGATLWMIVMGILGMSTKFTECTLAVMYREKRKDGSLMGGPMEYLKKGLADMGLPRLGFFLSMTFCFMCMGGSFGGGAAFQVNQSLTAMSISIPFLAQHHWVYGLAMVLLVGTVIIGGIKRIALVASRIVPFMCATYILMVLYILVVFYEKIPSAFLTILQGAFTPESAYGGFLGVLVVGIQRAAFSNEAGLGSAAIAHSVARVNHPVEEGAVALLEPFIDTVVVCTMTALVIVITGAYNNPEYMDLVSQQKGAALTSSSMGDVVIWFPYLLSLAVFLFAFSTIISWSYYGERCFSFIFGENKSLIYKLLLLFVIFISSIATSKNVMNFGDLMILGMAFPNLIGVLILSGKVKKGLKEYQEKRQRIK
ncbi:MAG: alanine/glycine:cation symporter family protein [Bdellovibrionales bacterium]|nr:alanine/glycine:cation symporter family protein [Bdellovibrionales bacterium]